MTDTPTPGNPAANLKKKLAEALEKNMSEETSRVIPLRRQPHVMPPQDQEDLDSPLALEPESGLLEDGRSVYSLLAEPENEAPGVDLDEELRAASLRLQAQLEAVQEKDDANSEFDGTLSLRGVAPEADVETEIPSPPSVPASPAKQDVKLESVISGGSMADLSGYKDLSKAPMSFGDDDMPVSSIATESSFDRGHHMSPAQAFGQQQDLAGEVDTEFSGNVKTLIRLVNELPEGVTKQTGAQIIRLTMEAMGISMEDVLSEAQSAQSEMLDAVRANIKKIEEYKTVIRKLETDIKYYQGKANELSEIIDLFILSNTSSQKLPSSDD